MSDEDEGNEFRDKNLIYYPENGFRKEIWGSYVFNGKIGVNDALVNRIPKVELKPRFISQIRDILASDADNDVNTLKNLEHPKILKIYSFFLNRFFVYIVLQQPGSGMQNLDYFCKNTDSSLSTRLCILKQIGEGLKYLHGKEIIHGDLRAEHVLLYCNDEQNEQYIVKLTDFGTWKFLKTDSSRENREKTTAEDVYSYGKLVQDVLNLKSDTDSASTNSDEIILAALACNDAMAEDWAERPFMYTLIEHPMFWKIKDKSDFLAYLNKNYFTAANLDNNNFIDRLNKKYSDRYDTTHWSQKHEKIEEIKNNRPSKEYEQNGYKALINFVRNTCEHFGEKSTNQKKEDDFNFDRNNFAEFILGCFPFLIYDSFTCYKNQVNDKVISRLSGLKEEGMKRFPSLHCCNYFTSLEKEISDKKDLKFLVRKEKLNKSDILCLKDQQPWIRLELLLKFVSQERLNNRSKKKLIDTIFRSSADLDFEYYDCIRVELGSIDVENKIKQSSSRRGCKFRVFSQKPSEVFNVRNQDVEINVFKCLISPCALPSDNKVTKFTLLDLRLGSFPNYHWWLEYKLDDVKQMYSFITDNDVLLNNILANSTEVFLYRSLQRNLDIRDVFRDLLHIGNGISENDLETLKKENILPHIKIELALNFFSRMSESERSSSNSLFLEILEENIKLTEKQYFDSIRLKEDWPTSSTFKRGEDLACKYRISNNGIFDDRSAELKLESLQSLSIDGSNCITNDHRVVMDEKISLNINDEMFHWWLEYKLDGTRKLHSFITGKDDELINILNNENCTEIFLHRFRKDLETIEHCNITARA